MKRVVLAWAFVGLVAFACKSKPGDADLSFDGYIKEAIQRSDFSPADIDALCSIHSFKMFVGNAEDNRFITWSLLNTDQQAQADHAAAIARTSFRKAINENIDGFLNAHKRAPFRCEPRHQTKTTVAVIYDDPGNDNGGNSSIRLYTAGFNGGNWTFSTAPRFLAPERSGRKITKLTAVNRPFELNLAEDLPDIFEQLRLEHVKNYQQVEFFFSGHGALVDLDAPKEIDLLANQRSTRQRNLMLVDTYGPEGKLTANLYAPVWRHTTAKDICKKDAAAASSSDICRSIATGATKQVGDRAGYSGDGGGTSGDGGGTSGDGGGTSGDGGGTSGDGGGTSGDGGGTSGDGGGTSGDGGGTSGKVFSVVKPTIVSNQLPSRTNPEGFAQSGQAASYNLNAGDNLGGVYAFNLQRLGNVSFPSLSVLNSCYQSVDVRNLVDKRNLFYFHYNSGPVYTWVVDFSLLDDFEYRALPFLMSKGNTRIRTLMQDGIKGEARVTKEATSDFCFNKEYCKLFTTSTRD